MLKSNLIWIARLIFTSVLSAAVVFPLVFSSSNEPKSTQENNQETHTAKIPINQKVKTLTLPLSPPPLTNPPSYNSVFQSDHNKSNLQSNLRNLNPGKTQKVSATITTKPATPPPFDINQSLKFLSPLFDSAVSWGMVAIGLAEGNYRLFEENGTLLVQQTPLYYGHTDPGNLSWGQVVTNYGPCSDQGRSGGDIALAEYLCSQRVLQRLPINLFDLNAAGINPNFDIEALINTADLYNQASPIHSRRFPEALFLARQGGKTGVDAIAWARTASFYLNEKNQLDIEKGENKASGLLGICKRERRPVTEWQCVHHDQLRRANAINAVVEYYQKAQQVQNSP